MRPKEAGKYGYLYVSTGIGSGPGFRTLVRDLGVLAYIGLLAYKEGIRSAKVFSELRSERVSTGSGK
jgi:hypothetical protein